MIKSSEFIRGYSEILVLALLNKKDSYVYELVQMIEELTDGRVVISNPSLLIIIRKMQEENKVSSYEKENDKGVFRKYYKLTDYGKEYYKKMKEEYLKSLISMEKIIKG